MTTNHHAHTLYSDGVGTPEDYLAEAGARGLTTYGFSDHAPIPLDSVGSMSMVELGEYVGKIDELKETYAGRIDIYRSLEIDYLPGVMDVNSDHIRDARLDYTLGAVHYVDYLGDGRPWSFQQPNPTFELGINTIFGGSARKMVERYYALVREMIATAPPDVVVHLDRVKKRNAGGKYWDEHADWHVAAVEETLEAVAGANVIMEVNTRGLYLHGTEATYPTDWIVARAHERGIRLQVNSDAHRPEHVNGGFEKAYAMLRKLGAEAVHVFDGRGFSPQPLAAAAYPETASR